MENLKPWSLLKKLTEHIEYVYYIGAVMNDTFRIKKMQQIVSWETSSGDGFFYSHSKRPD